MLFHAGDDELGDDERHEPYRIANEERGLDPVQCVQPRVVQYLQDQPRCCPSVIDKQHLRIHTRAEDAREHVHCDVQRVPAHAPTQSTDRDLAARHPHGAGADSRRVVQQRGGGHALKAPALRRRTSS